MPEDKQPLIDYGRLPIILRHGSTGRRWAGGVLILLICAGFYWLYAHFQDTGRLELAAPIILLLTLVQAFRMFALISYEVSFESVTRHMHFGLYKTSWREPKAHYRGLLLLETEADSESRDSRPTYQVVLKHATQPRKDVNCLQKTTKDREAAQRALNQIKEVLKLHVLESELPPSVNQKTTSFPLESLQVLNIEGGGTEYVIKPVRSWVFTAFSGLFTLAGLGILGFGLQTMLDAGQLALGAILIAFGGMFSGFAGLIFGASVFGRFHLKVGDSLWRFEESLGPYRITRLEIPESQVTSVKVISTRPGSGNKAREKLRVNHAGGEYDFASGSDPEVLRYLGRVLGR